jgi:anaerobic magnesium-protoporphyrin IX monomethyl ester cyclase
LKILLIQPPITIKRSEVFGVTPPLSLAYLAAVAEQDGHHVKILDTIVEGYDYRQYKNGLFRIGLPESAIQKEVERFQPDLVGISCPFTLMDSEMRAIASLVKSVDLTVPVVVGGAHPSSMPEYVIGDPNVDFLVACEGEKTFQELANRVAKGSDYFDLKGVWLKINGKIRKNPERASVADLDTLPFPARHLLQNEKYISLAQAHGSQKRKRYTSMITSRGCPGRCVFCSIHSVWGYKWRARSPENVVDEIEQLVSDYGIQEIHFEDDNLTLSNQRASKICDLIVERGIDISWTTPNGVAVQTLDAPLLGKMKKSGCYQLCFGIESGDPHVLKEIIHKPLNLERVKKVVDWSKKLGIWTHGFFVIGFPGESPENIQRTLNFAKLTDLDSANFFLAAPYPGTPLFELVSSQGSLKGGYDLSKLRTMDAAIDTDYFTAKELINLQKKVYFEFMKYRLKREIGDAYFLKRLLKVSSPDDVAFLVKKIRRFVRIFR